MRTQFRFILWVSVASLFLTCTKKKALAPNAGDYIVVGDAENMLVKKQDTGLNPGYLTPNQLAIDIDNDQITDFVIQNVMTQRTNWQEEYMQLLSADAERLICGNYVVDSIFHSEEIETGKSNPTPYSSITSYTNQYISYFCERNNRSTNLFSTKRSFSAQFIDSCFHLSKTDEFASDTILFYKNNSQTMNQQISANEMLTTITVHKIDCNGFDYEKKYCFGVKIRKNKREYLGWIKVRKNYGLITLLETAIQKEKI